MATKLHACVMSTIPASYSFCRTVAERFIAAAMAQPSLVPGPGDDTKLLLDANQSSSTNNTITNSSVTQTGIRYHNNIIIQITMLRCCLLIEIKTVAAKKEINQHSLCSFGMIRIQSGILPLWSWSFLVHDYNSLHRLTE